MLNPDGWNLNNYNANGIVGYQHEIMGSFFSDTDPDRVIGKGSAQPYKKRGEPRILVGTIEFEPADVNPLAEKIFRKVAFGTLKASSVGFIPTGRGQYGRKDGDKTVDEDIFFYDGQELLEWSIVNIPSNPHALKRYLDQVENLRSLEYIKKQLRLTDLDLSKITVEEAIEELSRKRMVAVPEATEKPAEPPVIIPPDDSARSVEVFRARLDQRTEGDAKEVGKA